MAGKKPKVAVLGVGNIGAFHFREFLTAGAEVTSILGSSPQSAEQTAENLHLKFGVKPKAYHELNRLLANEVLDAVSICTPPALHYIQAKKSLEEGLSVMCEKPFVQESTAQNYAYAQELASLAKQQNLVLTVNTQWPAIFSHINKFVDLNNVTSFGMHTQPGDVGAAMLSDHLPHTNSLLVKFLPNGHADNIQFKVKSERELEIFFTYKNIKQSCNVTYGFKHKEERPREVKFQFNGVSFYREIGENYRQFLVVNGQHIPIEDPLKVSIKNFICALKKESKPLISLKEALENIALQDKIISEYEKVSD